MERVDVVVVGGGLAGWSAAVSAAGSGRQVRLVDPSDRGGRAATDVDAGFRLNRGAHALYEAGPGRAVLRRLGIDPPGSKPPIRGGRARRGDQIGLLPSSPGAMLRTPFLSPRERARFVRMFAGVVRWKPAALAAMSTNEWMDDLGLQGDVRAMAAMFFRLSTYAADHDALSADVAATQLQLAVKGVRYLDGGWGRLVDDLSSVAAAGGVTVRRTKVHAVVPSTGGVDVVTDDGEIGAVEVVLAAGSPAACAHLLPEAPQAWRDLGPAALASCLDVGLDHLAAMTVLLGIDRPLYAIRHSPPADLAPPGGSVVHAMQYLREDQHLDPAASRRELEDHVRLAGVDLDRAVVARYLHRMTVVSAMPTPDRGGLAGRPGIDSAGLDHVLVAGDWIGPTGHLADASLASGEAAGALAARRVESRQRVH